MNSDQQLAVEQLRDVASRTDDLEVVAVKDQWRGGSTVAVDVSISCAHFERAERGLALRNRERFTILITEDFPFEPPEVFVLHKRFSGFPHVNWGFWLCLYVAPQTEWNPSHGMHGFLRRLEYWLRQAAIDELDPTGGALHPPAAYNASGPMLIARENTPTVDDSPWIGQVDLLEKSDRRVDLLQWGAPEEMRGNLIGAAILLHKPTPLEFPSKVSKLLEMLAERGVERQQLFRLVADIIRTNEKERPLVFVVGTPMRGIRGESPKQHLTAWCVPPLGVKILDLEQRASQLGEAGEDLHADVVELFESWAESTKIEYCRVREDRPEVTQRRDMGRPMEAFAGKSIEVWGCGAIGSHVAEWIVRAGAKKVVLRDSGSVTPGILVRQPFTDGDIGSPKAEVLAARLRKIYPDRDVASHVTDVVDDLRDGADFLEGIDAVIDATASQAVLVACERKWCDDNDLLPAIASLAINSTADRGMGVLVTGSHSGGPLDATRKMKIECCHDEGLGEYADAFFPERPPEAFQPEPGCSDATFIGSAVDVATLTGLLLNRVAGSFASDETSGTASGYLVTSNGDAVSRTFTWESDQCFIDPSTGYETRVAPSAWRQLHAWARQSRRQNGPEVETGGLLFGERDDFLNVVWVTETSGPPPDSEQSEAEFI
ncbi:MAG: ThiF family adenylyltransferase, partial [Planctomycetota bacterium]